MLSCVVYNGGHEKRSALVTENRALLVESIEHDGFVSFVTNFVNPTFGSDMNVNVGTGGVPEVVYKENVEWTTSALSGTWDFDYTGVVHAGSKSIDATSSGKNGSMQAKKSSPLDLSDYSGISGWIYFTKIGSSIKQITIYGYDTSLGSIVGIPVTIENYIHEGVALAWQYFIIPLEDFELNGKTIDSIRITNVGSNAESYILDDIQVEKSAAGGLYARYSVLPVTGRILYVHDVSFTFVKALNTTLADSSMPKLSYDSILGTTLSNGILLRKQPDDEFSFLFHNLIDFVSCPNVSIQALFCDGTNTILTLKMSFYNPIELETGKGTYLSATVSEDLSGFLAIKAKAGGRWHLE